VTFPHAGPGEISGRRMTTSASGLPVLAVNSHQLRVGEPLHLPGRRGTEPDGEKNGAPGETNVPLEHPFCRRIARKTKPLNARPAGVRRYDRQVAERDEYFPWRDRWIALVSGRSRREPEIAEKHRSGRTCVHDPSSDRAEPAPSNSKAQSRTAMPSPPSCLCRCCQRRAKRARHTQHNDASRHDTDSTTPTALQVRASSSSSGDIPARWPTRGP
jgi:hypothetical protein